MNMAITFWPGGSVSGPGTKRGLKFTPVPKSEKGCLLTHGMGVVIGETTEIGDDCTLYQNVTLGGTGKDKGKRHPTLGNNVLVGSGAKVLGPFRVGDNARVAAGAVVLSEVPDNATAVGVPARVVRINGEKPAECTSMALDQVHVSDPVEQALQELRCEMGGLEQQFCHKNRKSRRKTNKKEGESIS